MDSIDVLPDILEVHDEDDKISTHSTESDVSLPAIPQSNSPSFSQQ